MAKSLKKHLKVGDIIITPNDDSYQVTHLRKKNFSCIKKFSSYHEVFYYTKEMTILRNLVSNYEQRNHMNHITII